MPLATDLLAYAITFAVMAIPMLLAITLHEAAHAYTAFLFGDKTAYNLGRVSLNPIKHIDPVGTILIPILSYAATGLYFGWAKPVPIDYHSLFQPKKDMFWISIAGPGANVFMLIIWVTLLFAVEPISQESLFAGWILRQMCTAGIVINISLALLNILPIPPLDGSRLVARFLKGRNLIKWRQADNYGLWIVVVLGVTGILGLFLTPMVRKSYELIQLIAPL